MIRNRASIASLGLAVAGAGLLLFALSAALSPSQAAAPQWPAAIDSSPYPSLQVEDRWLHSWIDGAHALSPSVEAGAQVSHTVFLPLIVRTDVVPPTVVSTQPADGATGVSRALAHLTIRFSEPMNPSRANIIYGGLGDFDIGYDAATNTFIFTRTSTFLLQANRTFKVTINPGDEGGFQDLAGNRVATTYFSFTTEGSSDTVAPTVVSTQPPDGATGVRRDLKTLTIRFSEPMNPFNGSIIYGGLGDFTIAYEPVSNSFVFTRTTPGLLPANRRFTVTINPGTEGGFQDLAGNRAATTYFSFMTGN